MKTKDGIKALKNELRNYKYYLDRYNTLKEKRDDLFYQLSGIKAIDYAKALSDGNFNLSVSEEKRLEMIDRIDYLEQQKNNVKIRIDYVDWIIDNVEEEMREPIKDIYINGHTFYYTSAKHNISISYLQYRIDKNLNDIIKKEAGQ